MAGFLGVVSSEDWADDIKANDWTAQLFRLYPNGGLFDDGAIPITGITAAAGNTTETKSSKFYWFDKALAAQACNITANTFVHVDAALSVPYLTAYTAYDAAAGVVLYITVPIAFMDECVKGYDVLLTDTSDDRAMIRAAIIDLSAINATYGALIVKTYNADSASADYNIGTCDRVIIMGSSFPEGSPMPPGMHYDPTEYYNYTGISKNAVEQTGTAMQEELRTEAGYSEDIREQGELHSIGEEWKCIFGYRSFTETDPETKKPKRTSMGCLEFIDTYNEDMHIDWRRTVTYAGQKWVQGGAAWMEDFLADYSIYAPSDVFVPCGNLVLKAVNDLAKYMGYVQLKSRDVDFGLKIHTWETPYMDIHFKPHPLFARETSLKRAAMFFHPKNLIRRPLRGRDTAFLPDINFDKGGENAVDTKKEGWRTECGWQFLRAPQWAFLNGFGVDLDA